MALCEQHGFAPASPSLASAVSSLLLHDPANWLHVGGNLVFLVTFGRVVEREIGTLRFLGLFLAAGVAGAALHGVVAPNSTIPLVGASASIFGVVAVAGVLRPRLLGFAVAFGVLEVFHACTGGIEGVAFGAHLGGLAAGTLLAALWRDDEATCAA